MSAVKRIKPIAIYFPQFHSIEENNLWWGEGFTDWTSVKSAKTIFKNHYQPRIPKNENYYDQSQIETLIWQVELAKNYGIYGFCHYHYWFDGKQLLETPTNLMLENQNIDFPFCLSWANETWSRRWDGRDDQILIKQTHLPVEKNWKEHYDYLIKAWSDPRAIKIDDKPVFIIYRPQNIEKINEMLAFWQRLAKKDGLKGLYFIYQKQYEVPKKSYLKSFNGQFQFQPFEAIGGRKYNKNTLSRLIILKWIRALPESIQDRLRSLKAKMFNDLTIHDYDEVWNLINKDDSDNYDLTTYPGAFVDWDNTSRYKKRATIFKGASPEKFSFHFQKLVFSMKQRNLPENYIFINAWNEWAESAYLEPDEKYDDQYLRAIHEALLRVNSNYESD